MPEFQFDSFADFIAMGGDGFYVWTAYGLFAVFVIWCVYMPRLQRRSTIKLIHARARRDVAIQQRHGDANVAPTNR